MILVLDLLQTDYGSLLNCADWAAHPFIGHFREEWLLLVINSLFFIRIFFTFVANNYRPLAVDTVLDTQLLAQ